VFADPDDFLATFRTGNLDRDVVVVVRYQGPAANGMPELHSLTPSLGVLQDRGFRVALVTDGRMSGASGKIPAAIHLTPEAAAGGPLARIRDGDLVTLDCDSGLLYLHVDAAELDDRPDTGRALRPDEWVGTGRELFAGMRASVGPADEGATVFGGQQRTAVPA
jgi:phosphogluconate dehydratase